MRHYRGGALTSGKSRRRSLGLWPNAGAFDPSFVMPDLAIL